MIEFKLCVLTFLALKTDEPGYLREKLHKYVLPAIQTRHALNPHRLEEPIAKSCFGWRAFSHSAPRLYNKLPDHIKNCETIEIFKKKLKTHLFEQAYDLNDQRIQEGYRTR